MPRRPGRRRGRSSGKPEDRPRRARRGSTRAAAAPARPGPATRSTATSLRGSNAIGVRRRARPRRPRSLHGRVVLAGDDVGVRHHEARRRRPSPSPRRPGRRRCRAPARRCAGARATSGRARPPRVGGGDVGPGPSIAGNGSKRASALRTGPRRRQHLVELRRIAERWMSVAQLARARRLQHDRARDPHHARARSRRSAPRRAARRRRRTPGSRTTARRPRAEPSSPPASTRRRASAPSRPNSGA